MLGHQRREIIRKQDAPKATMTVPNQPPKTTDIQAAGASPDKNRRRLVGGGLGAAPLLMTLVSRPVLGQDCQTPSQWGSMPTSHAHGRLPPCNGASATFWSQPQNFDEWPSPYYPKDVGGQSGRGVSATRFTPTFSPSPYPPETTFLDVLTNGGLADSVARQLVAARLNVAKGWVPVLDEARIQDIWFEYTSKGYFEPTAGVKWYEPEIVAYLESLTTK
jgi:hypothetical protein